MTDEQREVAERIAKWCGFTQNINDMTWKHPDKSDVDLHLKWFLGIDIWFEVIWPKVEARGSEFKDKWFRELCKGKLYVDASNASAYDRCLALCKLIQAEEPEPAKENVEVGVFRDGIPDAFDLQQLADALLPHLKGRL